MDEKEIIKLLNKIPKTKLIALRETFPYFLPKKSKTLSTNLHKILLLNKNPRDMTILSHLILENMIEEIIRKKVKEPNPILEYSFYNKIKIMYSFGLIPEEMFRNLKLINTIRNNFAHNLKFSLTDFSFNDFSYFKNSKLRKIKRRKLLEEYNQLLLSFCILWTARDLQRRYPFLSLLDI
jgi:hypothetical protein